MVDVATATALRLMADTRLHRLSQGAGLHLPRRLCAGAGHWRAVRLGDLAQASLATSSRFFELDATAWSNTIVRVLALNVSNTTIDLAAATFSVQVTKWHVA